jgi:general secretion pathway protein E
MTAPPGRDLREAANGPLAQRLSPRYLDEYCLLPLGVEADGALALAVGGPLDPTVHDELTRVFQRPIRLVNVPAAEIRAALLGARRDLTTGGGPIAASDAEVGTDGAESIGDLRALAGQAPVITLVNVMLLDALRAGASDVHVETVGDGLRVRYRLDGVLHDVSRPSVVHQAAIISRIKIMAGLDIAERRLPQDGRIRLRTGDREVDLRVSTLPALHGESVVLRILDHGAAVRDLEELGMPNELERRLARLIAGTSGIILVTGPTGAGKTTTLYSALARRNEPGVKIVTVEDPVEYQMAGVTQVPVHRKAGLTFATALRSILRHDPDVIMVGEMRDAETAEIAIQAALTGHLVFSTLHTTDAASGITRLVDMGIEPYLVAATVNGILAQRLVRTICPECRGTGVRGRTSDQRPGTSDSQLPTPCESCSHTGFRGRTGIYELLTLNESIRRLIVERASLDQVRAAARHDGMVTLREDGEAKVRAGITTLAEVLRVTAAGEGEP